MSKWREHKTRWKRAVVVFVGALIILAAAIFCMIRFNAARVLNMGGGTPYHYVELVKSGAQNYRSLNSMDMAQDIYYAMLFRMVIPCPDPGGEGYMRITLAAGGMGQKPPPGATILLRTPDCFYVESSGQAYRFLGAPPNWESIWESAKP